MNNYSNGPINTTIPTVMGTVVENNKIPDSTQNTKFVGTDNNRVTIETVSVNVDDKTGELKQ